MVSGALEVVVVVVVVVALMEEVESAGALDDVTVQAAIAARAPVSA